MPATSNIAPGAVVPIPTLSAVASIDRVLVSNESPLAPPVKAKFVSLANVQAPELTVTASAILSPIVVVPVDERVVNAPVPGVAAPTETKLAAPAPVIFQLSSFKAREFDAVVLPIIIVSAVVPPVPILIVSALVPVPILIVLVILVDPKFKVVAAFATLKVAAVVVKSPPLIAMSSAKVSPPEVSKSVPLFPIFVIIELPASIPVVNVPERAIPVVSVPPAVSTILIPVVKLPAEFVMFIPLVIPELAATSIFKAFVKTVVPAVVVSSC